MHRSKSRLDHAKLLRSSSGMTLLEVLVVLVILGLIAALGSIQLLGVLGRAKADTARLQLRELSAAIDLFRIDIGRPPTQDEGLAALVEKSATAASWKGPYVKTLKALKDPWGNDYIYRSPGTNREFDLLSLGADGKVGGSGEDADVSLVELR